MQIPPVPYAVQLDQQRRKQEYARDNPAIAVFEQLRNQIRSFGADLKADEALGIQIVSGGSEIRLTVHQVGYATPSLIWFEGVTADGHFAKLLQSVSQLSLVLIAIPLRPGEKKATIGFVDLNGE